MRKSGEISYNNIINYIQSTVIATEIGITAILVSIL
jgi:hypothetical protein